jgi:hypothetical protein
MADADAVPKLARPFVALLLVAMIASALFVWEPWPLTSFRLFSNVRIDHQRAWLATTVDAAGDEEPYPIGAEPDGFRGFPFVMAEFVSAGRDRRDELCRTWVEGAPDLVGRDAAEVRIYLREWELSDRTGDRADEGTVTPKYACTAEGATAIG